MIKEYVMNTSLRALAAVAVAAVLGLAACGSGPEVRALTTHCAVVLDGSGSGTKLNVKKLMDQHLLRFLYDESCSTVSFGPITGSSQASRCNVPIVNLDPPTEPGDDKVAVRQAALVLAAKTGSEMLDCAKKEEASLHKGSDVLGGISRAAARRPIPAATYEMLVISDFAQRDTRLNLYDEKDLSPARREEIIAELKAKAGIPNLTGTAIITYGFGAGYSSDAAKLNLFRAFWKELISAGKGSEFIER